MIVLDPRWLCGSVCGYLLSQEFLDTAKPTGCYTTHDFQLATPDWNSDNLLPVLEALGMCTQVPIYFILAHLLKYENTPSCLQVFNFQFSCYSVRSMVILSTSFHVIITPRP